MTDNDDWLRSRTWDMYRGSHLITSLEDLFWALNVEDASRDDQVKAITMAMSLPSWTPAPPQLKTEAVEFINDPG